VWLIATVHGEEKAEWQKQVLGRFYNPMSQEQFLAIDVLLFERRAAAP